jgi:hypothetical protein
MIWCDHWRDGVMDAVWVSEGVRRVRYFRVGRSGLTRSTYNTQTLLKPPPLQHMMCSQAMLLPGRFTPVRKRNTFDTVFAA